MKQPSYVCIFIGRLMTIFLKPIQALLSRKQVALSTFSSVAALGKLKTSEAFKPRSYPAAAAFVGVDRFGSSRRCGHFLETQMQVDKWTMLAPITAAARVTPLSIFI